MIAGNFVRGCGIKEESHISIVTLLLLKENTPMLTSFEIFLFFVSYFKLAFPIEHWISSIVRCGESVALLSFSGTNIFGYNDLLFTKHFLVTYGR